MKKNMKKQAGATSTSKMESTKELKSMEMDPNIPIMKYLIAMSKETNLHILSPKKKKKQRNELSVMQPNKIKM